MIFWFCPTGAAAWQMDFAPPVMLWKLPKVRQCTIIVCRRVENIFDTARAWLKLRANRYAHLLPGL
jgi:hypothetical protein